MRPMEEMPRQPTVSLQPRMAGSPVPLTASQRVAWNLLAANHHHSSRAVAIAVRIVGSLDSEILQASLESVVSRHEALRTTVQENAGRPCQQISAGGHRLREIDLSMASACSSQADVRRLVDEAVHEDVELSIGPLFAATLLRRSCDDHVLVLAMDHMISDAASAEIVNRELWTFYKHGLRGAPMSLPQPRVQFGDYAVWLEQTHPSWRRQHESYWREHLSGAPRTELPIDCGSVESDARASAVKHIPFGKRLSDELRLLAQREGMLLPLAVLALYACVMSRWCGQGDLVLQFVSHGRRGQADLQDMVGFLANKLYFRITVRENDTFTDLLQQVRIEFESAFRHYDFDRASLMELVPATDLLFNWISGQAGLESGHDRDQLESPLQLQRFQVGTAWLGKLWPFFYDTPAGIIVAVAFRPDLFTQHTVEQFGDELRSFARAFIQDLKDRVSSVSATSHAYALRQRVSRTVGLL